MDSRLNAEKEIHKDLNKFASKLFIKEQKSGSPIFSSHMSEQYFETTYKDENRSYTYTA